MLASVDRLAAMTGIKEHALALLQTAAWFHDVGCVKQRQEPETDSMVIARGPVRLWLPARAHPRHRQFSDPEWYRGQVKLKHGDRCPPARQAASPCAACRLRRLACMRAWRVASISGKRSTKASRLSFDMVRKRHGVLAVTVALRR